MQLKCNTAQAFFEKASALLFGETWSHLWPPPSCFSISSLLQKQDVGSKYWRYTTKLMLVILFTKEPRAITHRVPDLTHAPSLRAKKEEHLALMSSKNVILNHRKGNHSIHTNMHTLCLSLPLGPIDKTLLLRTDTVSWTRISVYKSGVTLLKPMAALSQ